MKSAISNQVNAWISMGKALIDGLKKGMEDRVNAVLDWMRKQLEKITALAEKIFLVQSPSKVFAEIGQNLMLGLGEGINKGTPEAGAAMAGAASSVVNNFNLGVYTSQSSNAVQSNFAAMQALANI